MFVEQWRRRRPGDELRVLSAEAGADGRDVWRRERCRAWRTLLIAQAIRGSTSFVSGGGGLLQSSTSSAQSALLHGVDSRGEESGARSGHLRTGHWTARIHGQAHRRRGCAHVDLAIVRDAASATLLQELLPKVNVRVGADPVFLATDEATTKPSDAR